MTTSKDVRDMLGMTSEQQQTPKLKASKKKAKAVEKRPDGITRELFALMGERAPPIPIAQPKQFKAKRARTTAPVKWHHSSFSNQARDDGLELRHWRSEKHLAAENGEGEQNLDSKSPQTMNGVYGFAKYDVHVQIPQYDDALYEAQLKSDTWSKEETDYLVSLVTDFDQKWPIILDRYEFSPSSSQEDSQPATSARSMEDLKSRYYTVSAHTLAAATPIESMSASEFAVHEKMIKFNANQEVTRKRLKDALLTRSIDEKREEEYLLAELRRIYLHQQRFSAELKDIRQRLDHSLTDDPADLDGYTTSGQINGLFNKVFSRDRTKQQAVQAHRKSLNGDHTGTSSPTTGGPGSAHGHGGMHKKGGQGHAQQQQRQLSPRSEARFGVSTHERLSSGVSFRSDKLAKARQAKSSIQTTKIATVLAELGVPELLQLPTTSVCSTMEKLVSKVNFLIDARKVREKEENEASILKQQKALREGNGGETQQGEHTQASTEDAKDEDQTMEDANDEEQDGDGEEAEETTEMKEEEYDEEDADGEGDEEDEEEGLDDQEEEEYAEGEEDDDEPELEAEEGEEGVGYGDGENFDEDDQLDDDDDDEDELNRDVEDDEDGQELEEPSSAIPEAEPEPEDDEDGVQENEDGAGSVAPSPAASVSARHQARTRTKRSASVMSASSSATGSTRSKRLKGARP